jgi:hypothetical protein
MIDLASFRRKPAVTALKAPIPVFMLPLMLVASGWAAHDPVIAVYNN